MKKNAPPPVLPAAVTAVDTHCHLDMAAYNGDRHEVIVAARLAGVTRIITIGIDPESSSQAVELAGCHQGIYAAVGIHPHNTALLTNSDYEKIRGLAARPKVVAYGEIGLDYAKLHAPVKLQKRHFRHQVRLAKELGLPIIIHDREAHDDVLAILREESPFPAGGVMHCFSGDPDLAGKVVDLGFYISIPGIVTFNNAADLREVTGYVPLSSMLLETDGPFLAPAPKRGKRNEPLYLLYTARKIAELKNISLEEVAAATTKNAEKLFKIG